MAEEKCAHCGEWPIDPARPPYCSKRCVARAATKRWREQHPGYNAAYLRRWRAESPEKHQASNRRQYVKNRQARIEYSKAYAKANREKINLRHQVARKTSGYIGLICRARNWCAVKGLPFDLTQEWGRARWTGHCELTGIEFRFGLGAGPRMFSPSIDRIVPSLGYVQSNCRFVLHAVNALKSTGTDEEMYEIAATLIRMRPS